MRIGPAWTVCVYKLAYVNGEGMFWVWFLLTLIGALACGFLALVAAADPEGRGVALAGMLFLGCLMFAAANMLYVGSHLWRRLKGWA